MYYSSTIFAQLLAFIPKHSLRMFVGQHNAEKYTKKFTVWNQLVVLLYSQATGKDSLREIETSLRLDTEIWYHLGIKSVSKSTLARANSLRTPEIFEKLFYALLGQCKNIATERKFSFDNPLYSLDASVVNLCLSLCDWAKYRTGKGAIKLHVLLNNRTFLPTVVTVTEGNISDIKEAKNMELPLEKGSILIFDRGYVDYTWWKKLDTEGIYFVTRLKTNIAYVVSKKKEVKEVGIVSDDLIWIGYPISTTYDKEIRRVIYNDPIQGELIFITNNTTLSASEIALVYKERWHVELFFKWIKQNLKIKTFLGTSKNAVMNQIWVAMIYYLILSYIKFQTKSKKSLLEFTWIVNHTLLMRRSLIDILSLTKETIIRVEKESSPQLSLWDF